ncbi:MAG: hypothetical protein JNK85_11890 [Verrucomicrobiales bacterium]|nr:hypothetical protein [Verrucomicrobiales bacterium]
MNLPNYFIADLPADYAVRPDMVREACQTLKRNRERYLLPRSTESVVSVIVELARLWQSPHSPWRTLALEQGPPALGLSREMLAWGLDGFFRQLTARNLNALLVQDLGHPQRLDRLVANDAEMLVSLTTRALGPELLVHIAAGILPTPVILSMLHGLLLRSAQVVKCAAGASLIPRLFAHSLHDLEPKMASCLELVAWKGGSAELETVLFEEANAIVAAGSDETIETLRRTVPRQVRFLAHGHRVSAAYVSRESLMPANEPGTVEDAAVDVAAWDQLGCLSPHVIYVETGGMLPPEAFAARLSEALETLEKRWPRGPVGMDVATAIFQRRELYRLRAAADGTTRCWFSTDSTAWSVVYEADPTFQTSCLHRFVMVKPVDTLEECLRHAEMIRGRWSTVGLAGSGVRTSELAAQFAAWGIHRICPLGRMQLPPLTWRHDGRPVIGDLITWAAHEMPLDS